MGTIALELYEVKNKTNLTIEILDNLEPLMKWEICFGSREKPWSLWDFYHDVQIRLVMKNVLDMEDSAKYTGMTVNERLYASGNLAKFDKAVSERDIQKVVEILISVELMGTSIEPILKQLGLK